MNPQALDLRVNAVLSEVYHHGEPVMHDECQKEEALSHVCLFDSSLLICASNNLTIESRPCFAANDRGVCPSLSVGFESMSSLASNSLIIDSDPVSAVNDSGV